MNDNHLLWLEIFRFRFFYTAKAANDYASPTCPEPSQEGRHYPSAARDSRGRGQDRRVGLGTRQGVRAMGHAPEDLPRAQHHGRMA
jgi:hypothetical protein